MNDSQWYYERDGKQAGPISWEGLMAGLKMGRITSDTRVWASHLPEWIPLAECMRKEAPSALPPPTSPSFSKPSKSKTGAVLWVVGGIILFMAFLAIVVPALLAQRDRARARSEPKAVHIVKSGYFTSHPAPAKDIGDAVNAFFGDPKWESGIGTDPDPETQGKTLVNIKGKVRFMGKDVDAALQFVVNEDTGAFQARSLEFNGIPQNQLMLVGLIDKMYE